MCVCVCVCVCVSVYVGVGALYTVCDCGEDNDTSRMTSGTYSPARVSASADSVEGRMWRRMDLPGRTPRDWGRGVGVGGEA